MTKQYKPFDLAAAKAGAKLITRDGRAVTDIHHFESDKSNLPVAFHVEGDFGAIWAQVDGKYGGSHSEYDLFIAPVERTVYVNVYDSPLNSYKGGNQAASFATESDARGNADRNGCRLLAVAVPVTITE